MAKQIDLDRAYLKCAYAVAELSYAKRKKVGTIIVAKCGQIIAEGVNGMPSGFNNICETCIFPEMVTKKEVIHAESNALLKIARSTNSSIGATLYNTLAPCFECSKLIIQAGIVRVVYAEEYPYAGHTGPAREMGLDLLHKANIHVDCLSLINETRVYD